jgi:hypothetical protein
MKEVRKPVAGNLFYARNSPGHFGVIERVYKADGRVNVTLKYLTEIEFCSATGIVEDFAYREGGSSLPNYYVYLDAPDTPQNRLALQLKYA